MKSTHSPEEAVSPAAIVAGLRHTGLTTGDVVLVHAAMRTLGWVKNGAQTVVDALLEVVGPTGTLVVPTFTFRHEAESDPIIDPRQDPSEMGAISEAVRRHPQAHRSVAFRHSFAAIGRRARLITEIDPRLSPYDLRGSFGVMLAANAQILLLGVTYSSCTSHHFCEWLCDVPYRQVRSQPAKLRLPSGVVEPMTFPDYQPKPSSDGSYYGTRGADFNRLGSLLEQAGRVGVAPVGNAIARRLAMRDLTDLAQREAARDFNVFRTAENAAEVYTPLRDGTIVIVEDVDGAGRPAKKQLSVVDPARLVRPAVRP